MYIIFKISFKDFNMEGSFLFIFHCVMFILISSTKCGKVFKNQSVSLSDNTMYK